MSDLGTVDLLIILIIVFLLFTIIPALLRWLWNITMTEVFGLKEITFWQAFRLLIIAQILFGIWRIAG
jgi:hypothetical protein